MKKRYMNEAGILLNRSVPAAVLISFVDFRRKVYNVCYRNRNI